MIKETIAYIMGESPEERCALQNWADTHKSLVALQKEILPTGRLEHCSLHTFIEILTKASANEFVRDYRILSKEIHNRIKFTPIKTGDLNTGMLISYKDDKKDVSLELKNFSIENRGAGGIKIKFTAGTEEIEANALKADAKLTCSFVCAKISNYFLYDLMGLNKNAVREDRDRKTVGNKKPEAITI